MKPHIEETLELEELQALADALETLHLTGFGTELPNLEPGQARLFARSILSYIVSLEIQLDEYDKSGSQGSPLIFRQGRPFKFAGSPLYVTP